MHTLVTTALIALEVSFLSHISHSGLTLYDATVLRGHTYVIYGTELPEQPTTTTTTSTSDYIFEINEVSCMCTCDTGDRKRNCLSAAEEIVRSYLKFIDFVL